MIKESISLVVPVFNEEDLIKDCINSYQQKLSKLFNRFEIIVVDDGSTDNTPKILKQMRQQLKIKTITHPKNMGVGKAILDGFKKAKYTWVMHNSADMPFDLNDLNKVGHFFTDSDVVVAVRKDRSANTFFRKITSLTAFLLIKLIFRIPVDDFHFIQIYRRKAVSNIKIKSKDTFMPAELLIKLSKRNCRIRQFRSTFHKRTAGKSKYDNPLRYLIYLKDLFNLLLENSSIANLALRV